MINETNKLEKAQLVIDLLKKVVDEKYLNALNSELDPEYVSYFPLETHQSLEWLCVAIGDEEIVLDIKVDFASIDVYAVYATNKEMEKIFEIYLNEKDWVNVENTIEKFKEYVKNEKN